MLFSPVPCKYWPKFPLSIYSYTRKRDPSTQYPIKRTCIVVHKKVAIKIQKKVLNLHGTAYAKKINYIDAHNQLQE